MIYINIHSHKTKPSAGTITNCLNSFNQLPTSGFYSIGMHPWYIKAEEAENQFTELAQVATQNNVLAIGECGLDKVCKTDFELQQKYFIKQIQLANTLNKPLIIHCVKAYNEVTNLLQQQNLQVPVIFHGFNKNEVLAKELVNNGYYLSFGKHLLNPSVSNTFKNISIEKIFLETDDSDISIEELYRIAALQKNIEVETLINQITNNASRVFGNNFLIYDE